MADAAAHLASVELKVIGSPVLALESKGVHLILCSTCLNYFKLVDALQVSIVGGMPNSIPPAPLQGASRGTVVLLFSCAPKGIRTPVLALLSLDGMRGTKKLL